MESASKSSILIIDDEKTNILYLNRILSTDYEIYTAKDGEKGLKLVNEYVPDLILLDIVMPGMDGYEVLATLKTSEKTKAIPVIFITGLTGDEHESKGLALGADDYISKPFNDEIVRLRVRNQIKMIKQMRTIITQELAEHKSRTKAEFLSRMSHEMRTPMNAIMGTTSVAQIEDNVSVIQGHLKTIEKASREMMCLIDSMLDIADINDDKTKLVCSDFNVRVMVREALKRSNECKKQKQQSLSVEIDDEVPETVYGDEKNLSKALSHLLANAVKFTGEQGEILLKVLARKNENEILTLQFEVIDNGIGISKEHQESIFSLFEQVDENDTREFEGIGSGLFITKNIVQMMGGQIWVESEPGKGSKFVITVKVAK
ncbi:MAG: hybrid sensor histidine kinase/response regulator [Oscillospiraceae bacterium]|nr:hybrid sensor histidine kinase/response regulator [Oscillospiraceae bacterium]